MNPDFTYPTSTLFFDQPLYETHFNTSVSVADRGVSAVGLQSIGMNGASSDNVSSSREAEKSRALFRKETHLHSSETVSEDEKESDLGNSSKKANSLFQKIPHPGFKRPFSEVLSPVLEGESADRDFLRRPQDCSDSADFLTSSLSTRRKALSSAESSSFQLGSPRARIKKRARAQTSRLEWMDKRLTLWSEGAEKAIMINGKQYRLQQLGEGQNHKVFEFVEKTTIQVGNKTLSTDQLVLKILSSCNVGPNKQKKVIEGDRAGYESLLSSGVPVAEIYADPIHFVDSVDQRNGMFWLVEKMPVRIKGEAWAGNVELDDLDPESKRILSWVKEWLTKMANTQTDIINDFRLRNTMCDEKGNIKVIDYSQPETDKWDILYGISRYAVDWANGNQKVLDWLTDRFPTDLKTKFFESSALAEKAVTHSE